MIRPIGCLWQPGAAKMPILAALAFLVALALLYAIARASGGKDW